MKWLVLVAALIAAGSLGFVGGWVAHAHSAPRDCYIPEQQTNPYLPGAPNPYLPGSDSGAEVVCK
jgi:hypothetical protein